MRSAELLTGIAAAQLAGEDFLAGLDRQRADLVQKRNHILRAALSALPDTDRQLLSTLALLAEAVDYALLVALNPHLPPGRRAFAQPEGWDVDSPDPAERREAERRSWRESAEHQAAARGLARTVRSLERRGLLQYDRQADRYDLHPVVRGYASGRLGAEDRDRLGRRGRRLLLPASSGPLRAG